MRLGVSAVSNIRRDAVVSMATGADSKTSDKPLGPNTHLIIAGCLLSFALLRICYIAARDIIAKKKVKSS